MISDDLKRLPAESLVAMADRIDICAGAPASFADARGSKSLGSAAMKLGALSATAKAWVVAIPRAEGTVTGAGEISHWALTGNGKLLVVEGVDDPQPVRAGNMFTLDPSTVTFQR